MGFGNVIFGSGIVSSYATWGCTLIFLHLCFLICCRSGVLNPGCTLKWSEVAQSCPTLCDPVDCSPPSSSVHGILQARILEWVAISFSRAPSRPRDWTQVSRIAGRRFNLWATREAQITRKLKRKKSMSESLYSPGVSKSLGIGPGNFLLNFLPGWEFFNAANVENLRIRIILIAHFCPKMLWFYVLYPTMLFLSDTVHKIL